MSEKAILAIEEALLSSLFTQRALVELLMKKGIIDRKELENELLNTETKTVGAGHEEKRIYLEKRLNFDRRLQSSKKMRTNKRKKNRRK